MPDCTTTPAVPRTPERISKAIRSRIKNPIIRNSAWMLGGQAASLGVQAAYFVVLARLLGATQYGILSGAGALVSMFTQYSGIGSGLLFLRHVSPDHSKFHEYWGHILLSVALMGTLVIIALHIVGRWMLGEAGASVLLILAIGDCVFGQLTNSAAQVFQTFEKMGVTAALNFLTNLLRLALAACMAISLGSARAETWASGSLCVSFIGCIFAIAKVTSTFGRPRFSIRLFFARIGEGFIFAISGSTTTVYNDVDKVMLGHYGMAAANGIYSMAYRVVNICTMPISSIHSAAFPRFFRDGVNGVAATTPFARRLLKRTTVLGGIGAVAMLLCAPILPKLAGRGFSEGVAALRWLCLIPLIRCFHLSAGDALAGAGFQRYRLLSQFTAAVGNFAMNLYLIPRYSWLGAAWASLVTDASLGLMNWALLYSLRTRNQ